MYLKRQSLWQKSPLLVIVLALICVTRSALAVVETYEFDTDVERQLYLNLVETLRCPKCQNQNINDSNAPIATDMRRAVYRLVKQGKQEQEIIQYMVNRFGEFVVYKPKLESKTWLLWFGPAVICGIGLIVVILIARKKSGREGGQPSLTVDEREKLKQILDSEK